MPIIPQVELKYWYCVRSQRKLERIATTCLQRLANVEVFAPELRYQGNEKRGERFLCEPLFPSYLFVRFELSKQLREIRSVHGVKDILHFGDYFPIIPDAVISNLRETIERQGLVSAVKTVSTGIQVAGNGNFADLNSLVTLHLSAEKRVAGLLQILGTR